MRSLANRATGPDDTSRHPHATLVRLGSGAAERAREKRRAVREHLPAAACWAWCRAGLEAGRAWLDFAPLGERAGVCRGPPEVVRLLRGPVPRGPAAGLQALDVEVSHLPDGKAPSVGNIFDWAEKQLEPTTEGLSRTVATLLPRFDVAQVGGVVVRRHPADRQ
eukprot:14996132-Alexandrium_andersonii.AAC.1